MSSSPAEQVTCPHCGRKHVVFRRDAPVKNRGRLKCLGCGQRLVTWEGRFRYSFQAEPPDSSSDMADYDTVMNLPVQKPREGG